jgi:hypothetical protein
MNKTSGGFGQEELAEFRAMQEEMLHLSQEYGEARLDAWSREIKDMAEGWDQFLGQWQGTLENMSGFASNQFDEITAKGEAASNLLSQSWQKSLTEMSNEMVAWGEQAMQTLDMVGQGWLVSFGGGGAEGDGWLSFLGFDLGLGGLFHQGGIVEAHRGMVVNPEVLMGDERLVAVQTGEGILPREAMVRLGEEKFEALRSGHFEVNPGGKGSHFEITIQVQSLDAAGVAGLDWDKVVQRHLIPAFKREMDRRW